MSGLNTRSTSSTCGTRDLLSVSYSCNGIGSASRIFKFCSSISEDPFYCLFMPPNLPTKPKPKPNPKPNPKPKPSPNPPLVWKEAFLVDNVSAPFNLGGASSVAYSNGIWVAVGQDMVGINPTDKNIYYSRDGKIWSPATVQGSSTGPFGSAGAGRCVVYANGLWVSTGYTINNSDTTIYSSTDGIIWNGVPSNPFQTTGQGFSIVYNEGTWVIVGGTGRFGNNNIFYSSDGINWNPSSGSNLCAFANVAHGKDAYGNGLWVALAYTNSYASGSGGPSIYYSTDGTSWTASNNGPFGNTGSNVGQGMFVQYANGIWITVGTGYNITSNIFYSTDGINWNPANGNPFGNSGMGNSLAYANGMWVAVGRDNSGNCIYYSTDNGINWTPVAGTFGNQYPFGGYSVSYSNGYWVTIGSGDNGNNIYYSGDGKTWTPVNGPFGVGGYGLSVTYANNKWVAAGNSNGSGAGNI